VAKDTKERARDIIEVLADLWPATFAVEPGRRRPLKVGIDVDILAAAGGAILPLELKIALGAYVKAKTYLRALQEGKPRIGLDGQPAGVVSAQDAAHARWRIERKIAEESARVRGRGLAVERSQRAPSQERGVESRP
jgi:ProP effector